MKTLRQSLIESPEILNDHESFQALGDTFGITRERARQVVARLVEQKIIPAHPGWRPGKRSEFKTDEEKKEAKKLSSKKYYDNLKQDEEAYKIMLQKRSESNKKWRKDNPDAVRAIQKRYHKNKKQKLNVG